MTDLVGNATDEIRNAQAIIGLIVGNFDRLENAGDMLHVADMLRSAEMAYQVLNKALDWVGELEVGQRRLTRAEGDCSAKLAV